jgi:hypothetical protein
MMSADRCGLDQRTQVSEEVRRSDQPLGLGLMKMLKKRLGDASHFRPRG